MRDAFVRTLISLARVNPRLMLLTGDLGFGTFEGFQKEFPKQFLNVGVSEQNLMGVAAGLAMEGRVVFAYSIANFSTFRCLEQIRNDIAYHNASVIVVGMGGGFTYGALGMTHHATEDLAALRCIPEISVVCPANNWEAEKATVALTELRRGAYLRLERFGSSGTTEPEIPFRLGKIRTLRPGKSVHLLTCGSISDVALQAARNLEKGGINAGVHSVHTLKPLDVESLCQIARDSAVLVTVEEHSTLGGLGGAVAECLMENSIMPGVFRRVGLKDAFSSVVGDQNFLRDYYGMGEGHLVALIREGLQKTHTKPN